MALQPSTGGTFIVNLYHAASSSNDGPVAVKEYLLWDRKAEGGFPGMSFFSHHATSILILNFAICVLFLGIITCFGLLQAVSAFSSLFGIRLTA